MLAEGVKYFGICIQVVFHLLLGLKGSELHIEKCVFKIDPSPFAFVLLRR